MKKDVYKKMCIYRIHRNNQMDHEKGRPAILLKCSEYIIDLFHSFRKLYWALLKKQNSLYINCFKHACSLLKHGNFINLINFLKQSDCLMWKEEQKAKLKSVIKYFATKEIAICNQAAFWNIGVNAEGQISHIIKWLLSYGAKAFNVKTFTNMLCVRIANINGINPIELLKFELSDDRAESNNFLKENNWKSTKIYPEFWYQGKISRHSSKTRKSVLRFNANKNRY